MRTLKTFCLLVSMFSMAPLLAHAADDCFGIEPICDYPQVAVCVKQQQYGWQGQGQGQRQAQSYWACQDTSRAAATPEATYKKSKPKDKNVNSGSDFFSDDFVSGSDKGSKKSNQRSDELFGGR